jgi:O-antigen/teichoic acid export membrane protein
MAAETDTHVRDEPKRSGATRLRGLLGKSAHRLGWGLIDQAVSSLTNFAVVLYAARVVDASQFGAFSLAYTTYGFLLSASRGLASGPLQVRFSGTDIPAWRRATSACAGTAVVSGVVGGIGTLAIALALPGTVKVAFIALGLTLPGLLLQDSWRYAFFALGRGSQAFLNDVIWAIAMVPTVGLLRLTHNHQVFWFVLAWGLPANVAAAAGAWQARVLPSLTRTWGWLRKHGDLGVRYLMEYTFINGAGQLRTYAVGIIVGLAAVGYLQAANTLMGPFMVIYFGMTLVTVPEAVRALHRSLRHLRLFCVLSSVVLAVMGLTWGIVLLIALPRGFGNWLIGPIWRPAYPLILPMTVTVIGLVVAAGATTGLHALGLARRSLFASLAISALCLVGGIVGPLVAGVIGAVWGVGLGTWGGVAVWWWQMRAGLREFNTEPQQPGLSHVPHA